MKLANYSPGIAEHVRIRCSASSGLTKCVLHNFFPVFLLQTKNFQRDSQLAAYTLRITKILFPGASGIIQGDWFKYVTSYFSMCQNPPKRNNTSIPSLKLDTCIDALYHNNSLTHSFKWATSSSSHIFK